MQKAEEVTRRRSTWLPCALGALLIVCFAAAPGQAGAATMQGYGNYDGDLGVNNVTTSFDGVFTTFTDSAGIVLNPDATEPDRGACASLSGTSVRCAYPHGYGLSLDAGNDTFTYVGGAPPLSTPDGRLFTVQGGDGVDILRGSPYRDLLNGDGDLDHSPDPAGNDQLFGLGGDDELRDEDGSSNTFDGGPGIDKIIGSNGADTIDGGDGDDLLAGSEGDDLVRGSAGDDDVEGGGGKDVADGGAGNDLVEASFHGSGCGFPDTLIGGAGKDSVYAACAAPAILKLRDGEKDTGRCLPAVKAATVEFDKRLDAVEGGACERKSCGKGKKRNAKGGASVAKKKKGCPKKKRKK